MTSARRLPPRWRFVLAVVLAALTLTSCVTIPSNSPPRAVPNVGRSDGQNIATITPTRGSEPETIVRDFLKANAVAVANYRTSRAFLVASGRAAWPVPVVANIVSKIDVIPTSRADGVTRMTIRAESSGSLARDGTFSPRQAPVVQEVQLVRDNGEWRIQGLSSVQGLSEGTGQSLLIDASQFRAVYKRHVLYFPDATGRTMVPDARWVATTRSRLAADLLVLLARGPRAALAGVVANPFGTGASVRGSVTKADGSTSGVGTGFGGIRVDFTGLPRIEPDTRPLLASQVVWTLSGADVQGPYVIDIDGAPLNADYVNGWTTTDVAATNPSASSELAVGLHAVVDGRFVSVIGQAVEPVAGPLGTANNIRSVGLSWQGKHVAAVINTGAAQANELVVGALGGVPTSVVRGNTLTRPTWAPDEQSVWTVVDGTRVVKISLDLSTGETSQEEVDTAAVRAAAPGPISELRLSRDGVRAAMIVGGKVLVGVVGRKDTSQPEITEISDVSRERDLAATSLDWNAGDNFIVGRSTTDSPVLSVQYDSGDITALASRNLSPPMSLIAATGTTVYATDTASVWQLRIGSDPNTQYWQQVVALAGGHANAVAPG